ncbi:MAG TPA: hypothetical protein VIV11_10085, partial [Kofleriaceae bacterium]
MRLVLCALLACGACTTQALHRAAFVPHATPVHAIGQPNPAKVSATVGASNIVDLQPPGVGDPNAGVAVPGKQLRGALNLNV